MLLIDDVQFLEGKARTADELFHTFNALHDNGAQLVFTADRMPGELSQLAERLRQRFEWGLTAPVGPPDLSMRLIVLANLVRERGDEVAPEALRAIASRAFSNLRMLEGALNRVIALSSLTSSAITPEAVERALPGPAPAEQRVEVGIDRIQGAVADELGVSLDALLSPNRSAPVVRARQIAMYLSRRLTDLSTPAIATAFKRRDHTTVLHAVRRVEAKRTEDAHLNRALEQLTATLTAPPSSEASAS